MKSLFYRITVLIAGLALLLDGLALLDFLFHPLGQDYNFQSTLYRAVTVLVLMPATLLVGFLIIRRVPGNPVGPLLIAWSGTIAYNSTRLEIGLPVFSLYYAYDIILGWVSLFIMFLHFPDGKIYPPVAARWIYRLLPVILLLCIANFLSTQPLQVVSSPENFFAFPGLQPYNRFLTLALLVLFMPLMAMIPVSFVLRYRKGSPLERQQIKWVALFGGIFVIYTILVLTAYPLLTGNPVMTPGTELAGMIVYLSVGLFPPLAIGISIFRYRLWDIDRIIRRTLVYALLTVILSVIYFGGVLLLQSAFAFLFDIGSSDLAIVLSTLAIAALFTPVRSSVQSAIDRRFYRQKYDTEQTLARFTATIRSEVMLEPVAGALLSNVEEAIQPEGASLWLVSSGNKKIS